MKSITNKIEQEKKFTKSWIENGENYKMNVTISYGDSCENGHNTFHITGDIYENGEFYSGGCIHDEIRTYFPDLAKYIKWHGTTTDGPLYYIENTIYHAENGNLEFARNSAIWPNATLEQLLDVNQLNARLPALMKEFYKMIISIPFKY